MKSWFLEEIKKCVKEIHQVRKQVVHICQIFLIIFHMLLIEVLNSFEIFELFISCTGCDFVRHTKFPTLIERVHHNTKEMSTKGKYNMSIDLFEWEKWSAYFSSPCCFWFCVVRSLLMQSIERGDVPKIHKIIAENPTLLNDGLDEVSWIITVSFSFLELFLISLVWNDSVDTGSEVQSSWGCSIPSSKPWNRCK